MFAYRDVFSIWPKKYIVGNCKVHLQLLVTVHVKRHFRERNQIAVRLMGIIRVYSTSNQIVSYFAQFWVRSALTCVCIKAFRLVRNGDYYAVVVANCICLNFVQAVLLSV